MREDKEQEEKQICADCVGEEYLRSEIERIGTENCCSYCETETTCLSLEKFGDYVQQAFEDHYKMVFDEGWHDSGGVPVVDAIWNAAQIEEEVAEDLRPILESRYITRRSYKEDVVTHFSSDSLYEETRTDDIVWQQRWDDFEKALQQKNRFFCQEAAGMLSDIFEQIDGMPTYEGLPTVLEIEPDSTASTIYRARMFQSESELLEALKSPEKEFGPPPTAAARAGRMNAHGISVFYGANDPAAALSEVRPPVGSQVVVAKFDVTRPIRVLNLPALTKVEVEGSLFEAGFKERLERAAFLSRLSRRIALPVQPNHEQVNYLATQAIADYLSSHEGLNLDGIAYPAIQTTEQHLNVVLFHKAARVSSIELEEGVQLESGSWGGGEDDEPFNYHLYSNKDPSKSNQASVDHSLFGPLDFDSIHQTPFDPREETLRLDLSSLVVHEVKGIDIDTAPSSVQVTGI